MTMRIDTPAMIGRSLRSDIGRLGTMRDPDRAPIDVLIENLSTTGALLKTGEALPKGSLVSLGIAGAGMQLARVVRALPGAMAIEFMVALDPKAIDRVKTAETLHSVAIPQIETARADRAADDRAPAEVVRLPITALPPAGVAVARPQDTIDMAPIAPARVDEPPALDPRGLLGWLRPAAGPDAARMPSAGTWLVVGVLLVCGLAYLLG